MGIARFYRWLSERYPLINEEIEVEAVPEFDNMYLDMNGIIHNCSHGNTGVAKSESDVWLDIFKYVNELFLRVKPKKLLYLAVDGVAPRAKLNQQRSRRFRAAEEQKQLKVRAQAEGETPSSFDSNCITPGTEFMANLCHHLRFLVEMKLQEDPLWKGVTVILSGPDVPGEGEHKIMDFIRTFKTQAEYDPNTRHCIYGLDADLIMLALASHEPHFALLREQVVFSQSRTPGVEERILFKKDKFQLLHISVLREYLALEFSVSGDRLERVIDDFILICFLVGNDFLPHLPFSEISDGGLDRAFRSYTERMKTAAGGEWLVSAGGTISWPALAAFLQIYAELETEKFEEAIAKGEWSVGAKRIVGDHPKSEDFETWYSKHGKKGKKSQAKSIGLAKEEYYHLKFGIDPKSPSALQAREHVMEKYLEGLQWIYYYYYRGPQSWGWFYPYHAAPFASDLVGPFLEKLKRQRLHFELGAPFTPFQQLMSVLPAASGQRLLPAPLARLMTATDSSILDFYPSWFEIDMDGVRTPWGGSVLLPWVDSSRLIAAIDAVLKTPSLKPFEKERNSSGTAYEFKHGASPKPGRIESSLPLVIPSIEGIISVTCRPFTHPTLHADHFPHWVMPGFDADKYRDYPRLARLKIRGEMGTGVKVFNFESRNPSQFVVVRAELPETADATRLFAERLLREPCLQTDYPCVRKATPVAVHLLDCSLFLKRGMVEEKFRNRFDHEDDVIECMDALQKKGVSVELLEESKTVDVKEKWSSLYQQPVVEFGNGQLRLCCMVLPITKPNHATLQTDAPLFINKRDSPWFGWPATVSNLKPLQMKASRNMSESAIALEVSKTADVWLEQGKWKTVQEVSNVLRLAEAVVWKLLGSVQVRNGGGFEEIGLNYFIDHAGKTLCCAGISRKVSSGWRFSDFAVDAVKAYTETFPAVVEAVRNSIANKAGLNIKGVFQGSPSEVDYQLGRLSKFIKSKTSARLVPLVHTALPSAGVGAIETLLASIHGHIDNAVFGNKDGLVTTAKLLKDEQLRVLPLLGQRVVYLGNGGAVPIGSRGTVIGVYGDKVHTAQVELLLDVKSLGASSLYGRCSEMRGILVNADTVILTTLKVTDKPATLAPSADSLPLPSRLLA